MIGLTVDNVESNENKEGKTPRSNAMSFANKGNKNQFSRKSLNQLNLDTKSATIGDYTQEEVRDLIEDFQNTTSQESLQEVAELLWIRSSHFKRIVQYFADMATFSYAVIPKGDLRVTGNNPDAIRQEYFEIAKIGKSMNMKHEYRKVLVEAFKVDVFYGYVHYTEDDFYIQMIPRSLCKISSIEDGCFNYSINMALMQENIDYYKYVMPEEVISLYNDWVSRQGSSSSNRNSGTNSRGSSGAEKVVKEEESPEGDYVEIPSKNTICIKIDENNFDRYVPPFAGVFDSIFDIDGYKATRKNKTQIDNYMLIFQKIPMRAESEENNDFLIDYDDATLFHSDLEETVPENVGVITSPMDIEPIEFDKDSLDIDNVAKAERDFWSSSGVSRHLFSSDSGTSQGVSASIKTDEQIVFAVLRQLQRWTNRFLKYQHGESNFSIDILEITYFNKNDMFKEFLEAGQASVPSKTLIASALGIEPIQTMSLAYLENEVLDINNEWTPLQSSHTMSGSDTDSAGRPQADEDTISEETERKRDAPTAQDMGGET